MKTIYLFLCILFISSITMAQDMPLPVVEKAITMEVQVKGIVSSTWLLNNKIADIDKSQDYSKDWGYSYGGAFNIYFKNVGVGLEALLGYHNGGYLGSVEYKDSTGLVVGNDDYKSNVKLKTLQVPLLLKLKSSKGGIYFELGPQYNIISSAEYSIDGQGSIQDTTYFVTQNYADSYISAVFGFGTKIKFGKKSPIAITAGLRFQYSFTDLKGVDALANPLSGNYYASAKSANTHAVSGGAVIALVYTFGK